MPANDCPLEVGETKPLHPDRLTLDGKNPRLVGYESHGKDLDRHIIADLLDSADLRELLESIAANGFVPLEPLIVVWLDSK